MPSNAVDPLCSASGTFAVHSSLADTYSVLGSVGFLPMRDAYPLARAAALKAIALDWQLGMLKVEPAFDSLRSDPRFAALIERVGLPH